MIPAILPPELAAVGIALGLLFSLVCYLTTNLSPGGMITPGWLALTLIEDLQRAMMVVGVTALTYLCLRLLQKHVILYGKRLFATVVLIGVVLQVGACTALKAEFPLMYANQTLGFVVPGLIAYQLERQPKGATLMSVSTVTFVIPEGAGRVKSGISAGCGWFWATLNGSPSLSWGGKFACTRGDEVRLWVSLFSSP